MSASNQETDAAVPEASPADLAHADAVSAQPPMTAASSQGQPVATAQDRGPGSKGAGRGQGRSRGRGRGLSDKAAASNAFTSGAAQGKLMNGSVTALSDGTGCVLLAVICTLTFAY